MLRLLTLWLSGWKDPVEPLLVELASVLRLLWRLRLARELLAGQGQGVGWLTR